MTTCAGRRIRLWAVPVALAIVALMAINTGAHARTQPPHKPTDARAEERVDPDFSSFWLAAWWLRERPPIPLYYPAQNPHRPNLRIWTRAVRSAGPQGSQGELYDPWQLWGASHDAPEPKFYLYPPIFALLIVPLTTLSIFEAVAVWNSINAVAFVFGLTLIAWAWAKQGSVNLWVVGLLGLSALSYPVLWSLSLSQNSLLLFAVWAFLIVALERRWETSAGVALGSLAMVKLSPIVLLPWLLWRRYFRAAAVALGVVLALTGLSVVLAGWDEVRTYVTELVPLLSKGTHYVENQSLLGFLLRSTPGNDLNAPPAIAGPPSQVLWWGSLATLTAIQLWGTVRRSAAAPFALRADACSWMLFLLMISPVSWSHHYVNAFVPLLLCGQQIPEVSGRRRVALVTILGLCYLLIAIPPPPSDWAFNPSYPSLLSHRFFGALLLWATLHVWPFSPTSAIEPKSAI